MEIAFDIGGTFTDFVLRDARTGQTEIWKVPTTSRDPAQAVLNGLRERFGGSDLRPAEVGKALHATTIATNAILERKGARTALLTTAGFRDILLIGRPEALRHEQPPSRQAEAAGAPRGHFRSS